MEGHPLDWAHQPDVYKKYPLAEYIPLEVTSFSGNYDIFDISKAVSSTGPLKPMTLNLLSKILLLGFNITGVTSLQGKKFYYRSMPSAGALYPNEIYVAAYDIQGLNPGIYHYMIKDGLLVPLRQGNYRTHIEKFVDSLAGQNPAASIFISGIIFRSSWKYRKRAYRYVLNDTGHLVENLFHSCLFEDINPIISYDFDDDLSDKLLGFDRPKESTFALIHLPGAPSPGNSFKNAEQLSDLPGEMIRVSTVSEREISYDEILDIHSECKNIIESHNGIESYRSHPGIDSAHWVDIPYSGKKRPILDFPETVLQRRSKRNFMPSIMAEGDFHLILYLLCNHYNIASQNLAARINPAVGFLAENIEGYEKGYYLLKPEKFKTGLVDKGQFAQLSAAVCLNQKWLKNAAVHFLFMADLNYIENKFGPRGYRYIMMNAGRLGQVIYAGATALGLGCCGIGALFDYEAQEMLNFSNHTFLLYLVAAGPVKKMAP